MRSTEHALAVVLLMVEMLVLKRIESPEEAAHSWRLCRDTRKRRMRYTGGIIDKLGTW